tara:strand:- start:40708 stop:40860 length:153 start_codon:yes stop_codon:yes gene_type:complete
MLPKINISIIRLTIWEIDMSPASVNSPDKEFSAVIGITGNASGTIVLIAR